MRTRAMIAVALLVSGCAAPEVSPAAAPSCEQYASYSGRVLVGDPASLPTAEVESPLVPLIPGAVIAPGATVDSVALGEASNTVVFGLGGVGLLGWTARFVQEPLLRATDAAVTISGICVLQIDLTGGTPDGGSLQRLSPESDDGVTEVLTYPSADGVSQTFLGTRNGAPTITVEPADDGSALVLSVGRGIARAPG